MPGQRVAAIAAQRRLSLTLSEEQEGEEVFLLPSRASSPRVAKTVARKRLSEELDTMITVLDDTDTALDPDTNSRQLQMASKVLLRKVDVALVEDIMVEVEKANSFSETEISRFHKLGQSSKVDVKRTRRLGD